jgi:hypothetical protein
MGEYTVFRTDGKQYLDAQKDLLDRDSWFPCLLLIQDAEANKNQNQRYQKMDVDVWVCMLLCGARFMSP